MASWRIAPSGASRARRRLHPDGPEGATACRQPRGRRPIALTAARRTRPTAWTWRSIVAFAGMARRLATLPTRRGAPHAARHRPGRARRFGSTVRARVVGPLTAGRVANGVTRRRHADRAGPRADDGWLDLVVSRDGPRGVARWLPRVYRGGHLRHPRVVAIRDGTFAIRAAPPPVPTSTARRRPTRPVGVTVQPAPFPYAADTRLTPLPVRSRLPQGVRCDHERRRPKARGRLRRIEGQVQGLQRMLDNDAVLRGHSLQISRAGSPRAGAEALLGRHIESCVADALRSGSRGERQRSSTSCSTSSRGSEAADGRITLPVRGMHCAACVGRVERALGSVDGVGGGGRQPRTEAGHGGARARARLARGARAAVAAAGYELGDPTESAATSPSASVGERATRASINGVSSFSSVVGAALSLTGALVGDAPRLPLGTQLAGRPVTLLVLTTPVQFWSRRVPSRLPARPAHTAALRCPPSSRSERPRPYAFSVAVTLPPHAFMAVGA